MTGSLGASGLAGAPRRNPLAPAPNARITGPESLNGTVTSALNHPARNSSSMTRSAAGPNSRLIRASSPAGSPAITVSSSAMESASRTRTNPLPRRASDSGIRVAGRGSATSTLPRAAGYAGRPGGLRWTGTGSASAVDFPGETSPWPTDIGTRGGPSWSTSATPISKQVGQTDCPTAEMYTLGEQDWPCRGTNANRVPSCPEFEYAIDCTESVSYTHLRAHETVLDLVC